MKINKLRVGPIIGATSNKSVRIFGRAKLAMSNGQPRRAHGVVRIREKDKGGFGKPRYFKMNPNFDMTGIAVLNGLSDKRIYEYQIGWIFSEVDTHDWIQLLVRCLEGVRPVYAVGRGSLR